MMMFMLRKGAGPPGLCLLTVPGRKTGIPGQHRSPRRAIETKRFEAERGRRPMSSRSGELLDQGLDFFTAISARLGDGDWERPTPCADWTARDLLGHLATTIGAAISMMQGRGPRPPIDSHADHRGNV